MLDTIINSMQLIFNDIVFYSQQYLTDTHFSPAWNNWDMEMVSMDDERNCRLTLSS